MTVVIMMGKINKLNLKTKNEKEKHTNSTNAHCISQLLTICILRKNKKKGTWRLGIYLVLVEVCVLFGCTLKKLIKYWNFK